MFWAGRYWSNPDFSSLFLAPGSHFATCTAQSVSVQEAVPAGAWFQLIRPQQSARERALASTRGQTTKTQGPPLSRDPAEALWRQQARAQASRKEPTPQKGRHLKRVSSFHFCLDSVSTSHSLSSLICKMKVTRGSNQMKKHERTLRPKQLKPHKLTGRLFSLRQVVAESRLLVLKSDRPWECHFLFLSLSFLHCIKCG